MQLNSRDQVLEGILRYIDPLFTTMYYRTHLLTHSRRVNWHLKSMVSDILSVYPSFDVAYASAIALHHDDAEMITGDVPLNIKEKMTETELGVLANQELDAITILTERYGRSVDGFSYVDVLVEAKNKKSIEAQFVSFVDKFDGFGESMHELWAGNSCFSLSAGGRDGRSRGYVRRLCTFPILYPQMDLFFSYFPEYLPKPFDFLAVRGELHTPENIIVPSVYEPYERWKNTILENEGLQLLTTQVEYD